MDKKDTLEIIAVLNPSTVLRATTNAQRYIQRAKRRTFRRGRNAYRKGINYLSRKLKLS